MLPPYTLPQLPNYFISSIAETLTVGGNNTTIQLSTIYTLDGQIVQTADFAAFGRGILTIDPINLNATEFASFTALDPALGDNGGVTGVLRGLSFKNDTQIPADQKFHVVGTPVLIAFGTHNIRDLVTMINTTYSTLYTLIQSAIIQGAETASPTVTGITRIRGNQNKALGNCTISLTNPAVVTLANHGLLEGDEIFFSTTGTLPASITAGLKYYVLAAGLTANTFEISATFAGTPVNTNGQSQSGTQSVTRTTPYALVEDDLSIAVKFGGNGSDGPLVITSGTTTVDLANAAIAVKNYTSISITGTGVLNFINPHANGTVIVIKSQGDVTLTSSATPMIDASGMGATGGAGGVGGGSATDGVDGSQTNTALDSTNHFGLKGRGLVPDGTAGPLGGAIYGLPGTRMYLTSANRSSTKTIFIVAGAGGAGGGGGNDGGSTASGGTGGRGGGALLIECRGSLNFTTTLGISTAGKNGTSAGTPTVNGAAGGGGGGGAGGMAVILYNLLTAASGTINSSGGNGGLGAAALNNDLGSNSGTGGSGAGSLLGSGGSGGATASNPGGSGGNGNGNSAGGGGGGAGTNAGSTPGSGGTGGATNGGVIALNTDFA